MGLLRLKRILYGADTRGFAATTLRLLVLTFLSSVVVLTARATAADGAPPQGFEVHAVVRGLHSPTSFAYAPDGRIFIAEKSGVVRVYRNRRLYRFLDIRATVNRYADRGLLSIALDPGFERNRRVYLLFTEELRPDDPDQGHPAGGKLLRIEVSRLDPVAADPSTAVALVSGFKSTGPWHSVGGLDFDEKGRLVVGFGDGSPYCRSMHCQQTGVVEPYTAAAYAPYDLESLSGKILRLDPATGDGVPGNPYYNPDAPARVPSLILARGVRTPFRVQVDRTTGEILVGDVGTDQWEEINVVPTEWDDPDTELNFGWPCYEGGEAKPQPVRPDDPYCTENYYQADEDLTTPPWYAYRVERGAAVILGPRYRRGAYPSRYEGDIFVADWKRDAISTLADGNLEPFGRAGDWGQPVDLEITPRGTLAYLAIGTERLNEIVYVGGEPSTAGGVSAQLWIATAALLGMLLVLVVAYRAHKRSRRHPA